MKTKTEILAALAAAGVQADESLTIDALRALAAENGVSLEKPKPQAPKLVRVKAVINLSEGGTAYKPGEEFETTAERAAALGEVHVTIVG